MITISDIKDFNAWDLGKPAEEIWIVDGKVATRSGAVAMEKLDHVTRILADFYRAPLSMASVQPILDLAVELNPELKEKK